MPQVTAYAHGAQDEVFPGVRVKAPKLLEYVNPSRGPLALVVFCMLVLIRLEC